MDQIKITCF